MSLIEMMILGFLSERSMCGYELRKKMEQRGCGHFLGDNHAAIPWL